MAEHIEAARSQASENQAFNLGIIGVFAVLAIALWVYYAKSNTVLAEPGDKARFPRWLRMIAGIVASVIIYNIFVVVLIAALFIWALPHIFGPYATTAAKPAPAVALALSLSGAATTITQPFALNPGNVRADYSFKGEGVFAIELLDGQDKPLRRIASAVGAVDEAVSFKVDKAGPYKLRIFADGPWTVSLK